MEMEDQEDNDVILLSNTLEVFNLTQHFQSLTSESLWTLIATEYNHQTTNNFIPGIYVSYHRMVCIQLSEKGQNITDKKLHLEK